MLTAGATAATAGACATTTDWAAGVAATGAAANAGAGTASDAKAGAATKAAACAGAGSCTTTVSRMMMGSGATGSARGGLGGGKA